MAEWSQSDIEFMRLALQAADEGAAVGEVPVGAVIVQDGERIASGHNRSVAGHDPSAHAEIDALRRAGEQVSNYRIPGATLYVTLEPCVMCVGAIAQARIARVVFAAYDAKAGALGSVEDLADSRALNHRFEINGGLLADDASERLKRFFRSRR